MASRSTRRQVALGATDPPGSFDRGWGFLKVCASLPLLPSLFPCACRTLLYPYLSFLVKDACPPQRRGRRHSRGRPKGIPPSPPLPLLCSCPLSALAHDTYLPFSFLFVKPPYPLRSSFSCTLVIEGNDASSNHLEYGWNRCCIHSEGIPPSLFCLAPAFSLSFPLIILGKEAS